MANIIDIIIRADVEGEGEIKSLKGDFGSLEVSASSMAKGFAKAAVTLTALIGGLSGLKRGITESTRLFASFDDTMRAVAAVSGATGDEFKKLTELALEMGEKTKFTAQQAAEALKVLSLAGLSATESMEALPEVLNLSAASGADLAESTKTLTQILAGFGLQTSDLAKVNDVLVKTFTSSNTTLLELGKAFTFVGPTASSLGISIEEVSATLGKLADAGLAGERGGTALRNIFASLIAPTGKAEKILKKLGDTTEKMGLDLNVQAKALKEFGIEIQDTSGNMRPFVDIIDVISQQLGTLPSSIERNRKIFEIFGRRAGPAMAKLIQEGSGSIRELKEEIEGAGGVARQVAEDMEAGLGGALRRTQATIESIALALGSEFAPELITALENLRDFLGTLRDTALVQFGKLIADIISLGNAASDAEQSMSTMEESLKVMAGSIIVIREIFAGIVFEVNEIVKGLTLGVLNAIQVIQQVIGDVRGIISEDWAEGIRATQKNLEVMSETIRNEIIKDTEEYTKKVITLELELERLFETTKSKGGEASQTFKDIKKEVEDLSEKVKEGEITQEQYNAEIKKLEESAKTAFKAGNADLEKVTQLLNKAKDETGAVSQETKKLGGQYTLTAAEAKKFGNEVSKAGQIAIDKMLELSKTPEDFIANLVGSSEEVKPLFDAIAVNAKNAGEAMINAFAEGIQTAETLLDLELLVDALKIAEIAGATTGEVMAEGLDLARVKAAELASQAIVSANSVENLAIVMRSIQNSSFEFGQELSENLLPKLQQFSTIDLQNLQNRFDTLFDQAIISAETFNDVSESISNTISEKLGVSARDFETNITNAISESIKQFNLLKSNVEVTGDVLVESLSNIAKKAKTEEDIDAIKENLNDLAATGRLSFEEVDAAASQLDESLKKIVTSSAQGKTALEGIAGAQTEFSETLSQIGVSAEEVINTADTLQSAIVNAFELGAISAEEYTDKLAEVEKAIDSVNKETDNLTETTEEATDAADTLGNTFIVPWRRDVIKGIEDTGIELKKLFDFIVDNMIDAVSKYGSEYAINFDKMNEKMLVFVELQKKGFQEFENVLEFSKITGRDMTDELNNMIDSFELLDQQTLDNLRDQVEDLNETVKDARETARDFVEDFQEQLLRMEGDILAIETAEFERKKRELEQLLDETIDTIAQKDLKEALELLEQIHQEKLKKILEEEQAKKESAERANDFEKTLVDDDDDFRDETITEAAKKDITQVTEQSITVTINAPFAVHEDYVRVQIIPVIEEVGLDLSKARNR